MTSKPRLELGTHLLTGLAAVALFVLLAAASLTATFPIAAGFGEGSVTASIGYAMFDMTEQAPIASEPFLAAFEIIDVVLVAALVAAVMLARREDDAATPLTTEAAMDADAGAGAGTEDAAADGAGQPAAADGGQPATDGGRPAADAGREVSER